MSKALVAGLLFAGALAITAVAVASDKKPSPGSSTPASSNPNYNEGLSTEEKRTRLVSLIAPTDPPGAAKPFYKMSPDEVNDCYKFMFYYQDVVGKGKYKQEMPADFKQRIAAISAKWKIFT